MAKATPHRLTDEVVTVGRPLEARERTSVARSVCELLVWQRDLRRWRSAPGRITPDATPYVSLYAQGKLRGCFGSHEGTPSERVGRAFLLALADARYGGVAATDRKALAATVTYIAHARPVRADQAASSIEPGTHGLAMSDGAHTTVVLPSVARERGYDAEEMLEVLARKTKTPRSNEGIIWLLDVEEIHSLRLSDHDPKRAARRFLESLVASDGAVAFDVDAGTGLTRASGVMRHGRIAVAVQALAALGSAKARPARAWLTSEVARGLDGARTEEGWPARPDMVLGTLALVARAGVDVPLAEFAESVDARTCSPWHAAQAASVLGRKTPRALWSLCTSALERNPLSPYTLVAAHARGDARVVERCASALTSSIRTQRPFVGGAAFTPIPETALTAAAIEALGVVRGADVRRAVQRARAFVLARQVLDVPASMHPRALGAFRASPIAPVLRCDVVGHAVLALFV